MTSDRPAPRLSAALVAVALVVAVVGSLSAPLITSVATTLRVPLAAAQWTLGWPPVTGLSRTRVPHDKADREAMRHVAITARATMGSRR
ncbi:hypothetical protein ABCS02_07570 [Microbacterium sp. X-17]|uniref:hypothetical protein n=1 Tax=Microbacterium sp. X-17 TaxID=3144404 RepID=UPI0031F54BFC